MKALLGQRWEYCDISYTEQLWQENVFSCSFFKKIDMRLCMIVLLLKALHCMHHDLIQADTGS